DPLGARHGQLQSGGGRGPVPELLLPVLGFHLIGKRLLVARVKGASYADILAAMATLRPALDLFFEKVLVNAPDLAVRENRLTLLFGLKTEFSGIAEFSEIVPKTQETHTS
ncbi:MAG: hypothetical protein NTW74_00075, partial [Acidobacteria bacterium]|nr:hypothetical protein [Acidobacteriota bacterium]